MNRRLGTLFGVVALAALALVGCGRKSGVAYATVDGISTLPSDISPSVALASHACGGYVVLKSADDAYVGISLASGSKPTVDSVVRDGDGIRVGINEEPYPAGEQCLLVRRH